MLANARIRTAIADYAVRQLIADENVPARLRAIYPAAQANAELAHVRIVADGVAARELQTASARAKWETANRAADRALVAAVDNHAGPGPAPTVRLALTPVLNEVLSALRVNPQIAAVPGSAEILQPLSSRDGRVDAISSDQVGGLRSAAAALRGASPWLRWIALALIALAVAIATGRRAATLRRAGYGVIVASALVLIARWLAASAVTNAFVTSGDPNHGAVEQAWWIGTTMMRDSAIETIVAGAVLMIAGIVATLIKPVQPPAALPPR
jgi:hypothetical protein